MLASRREAEKKDAAKKALAYVKNGMTLGFGSGSTMAWFVKLLAKNRSELKIRGIKAIPSSKQIEKIAKKGKIKLLKKAKKIDLAIDGADQVDEKLNLLKGLGGYAFIKEKEIDYKARGCIIIIDKSKLSKKLNKPILVAIKPNKKEKAVEKLKKFGRIERLEKKDDTGNAMAKLYCKIRNPKKLEKKLNKIEGIAGNGIFSNFKYKPLVIVGEVRQK